MIALGCLLALLPVGWTANAPITFEAYRMVQFDLDGKEYGARRSMADNLATTLDNEPAFVRPLAPKVEPEDEDDEEEDDVDTPQKPAGPSTRASGDLTRKMVLIDMAELTIEKIEDIVDFRRASSVLILLEEDMSAVPSLEQLAAVEKYLLGRSFPVPMYFAFKNDNLNIVLDSLSSDLLGDDRYQLEISNPEAVLKKQVLVRNFQGWQYGAPSPTGEQFDTVAIVASYDTFGLAPGLSFGMHRTGTATVALLELVRIFSCLYSEVQSHGSLNLLFLLTGSSHQNYAGAKHWLRTADSRVLDSMKFALSLEDLSGEDLFLHVSKSPSKPEIAPYLETFVDTAVEMDVSLQIVHKRINVSSPTVDWQHEQFSRKRIVSATLSSRSTPGSILTSGSMFDPPLNIDTVLRNIRFVAEALCKQIYPYTGSGLHVIQGERTTHTVGRKFVESWLTFLSANQRFAPVLDDDALVLTQLSKAFKQHSEDAQVSDFPLEDHTDGTDLVFYKHEVVSTVKASRVKPPSFDVILCCSILFYLAILMAYLRGFKEFLDDFLNNSTTKSKRS